MNHDVFNVQWVFPKPTPDLLQQFVSRYCDANTPCNVRPFFFSGFKDVHFSSDAVYVGAGGPPSRCLTRKTVLR